MTRPPIPLERRNLSDQCRAVQRKEVLMQTHYKRVVPTTPEPVQHLQQMMKVFFSRATAFIGTTVVGGGGDHRARKLLVSEADPKKVEHTVLEKDVEVPAAQDVLSLLWSVYPAG